ncbi:MAG: ribosome maturation factor RimM [Lachnospiraceae bacterium]|nr:ribosome maturation factor RimM [Lachnospiraceae bacterium]
MLRVGVITQTHGIAGEVKIFPTMDELQHFKKLKVVYADTKSGWKELHIASVKFFKNQVILKFQEYKDINEVLTLGKTELWIERSQAVPCKENENFITDLIGLSVVCDMAVEGVTKTTDLGEELGICTDVMQTGANDVYVVERENGEEVLLPAIPSVILNVDLTKKVMLIHLLDGLI